MLKENRILVYPPTYIPYEVDLEMNDISFTFIDVAGDIRAQKSWLGLAEKADAIIYLVNSGESDRFDESYEVFQRFFQSFGLGRVPVAILATKSDMKLSVSLEEIRAFFDKGLSKLKLSDEETKPVEFFQCSTVRRIGVSQVFDWLAPLLKD
eukprot:TRINITY_DN304_c0_g2_i3.p1 TRINITY_DN304_c0_g2~~TRINITY_DN304_c0_g2_i3.p1  ORF type:complete len:152 (+),score=27.37 TRINITY_DN304_c0_g2_i3:445-900(+)